MNDLLLCEYSVCLRPPFRSIACSSPGVSYIRISPLSALDIDFLSRLIPAFPQAVVLLSFSVLFIFVAQKPVLCSPVCE